MRGSGVAALVAILVMGFAFNQRTQAQDQARLATSRELASLAADNLGKDPELSLLLSLQALVPPTPSRRKKPCTWRSKIHASD